MLISLIDENSFFLKKRLLEGFQLVFRFLLDWMCILFFYGDFNFKLYEEVRKLGVFMGYFLNVKVFELRAFAFSVIELLETYLGICLAESVIMELNPEKLLLAFIRLL
jgi:hypothetical protein